MVPMNKMMIALAGAMVCASISYAVDGNSLTAAAEDTSKIPEIVKSLEGQKGSDFAADVMNAIAKMPGNPSKKVNKMVSAAEKFLGCVPEGELPAMFANLTANVPFPSLPAWVDAFKPTVDAFTKDIAGDQYDKLVNDVMSKINALGNTSDADKTTISAFALKLLSRAKTEEEQSEWIKKVVLPAAYADQVKNAMPGVFAGNYDAVLGPDAKVVKADDKIRLVTPDTPKIREQDFLNNQAAEFGVDVIGATEDREGIERPEPMILPTGEGHGKKPPVPKPYKGQE